MGRGKVELKRIESTTSRQVSFSKRKNGLLKKAFEISVLCDAEVAVLILSSTGKAYQFSSHELHRIISRYRSSMGLQDTDNQSNKTMESRRVELDNLKKLAESLQTKLKHLAGEDLSSLGKREIKQLERQIRISLERVNTRKQCLISNQLNTLKQQQRELQEENAFLCQQLHEANIAGEAQQEKVFKEIGL